MYKALVLFLCVAVCTDAREVKTGPRQANDPAIPNILALDEKIVGGQSATEGQYPYQVALHQQYSGGKYFCCGGSIISPTVIVSAAHCLDGVSASDMYVVAGEHNIYSVSGNEQERRAERIIVHSDYDDWTMENDIALIILDEPFELCENVQTIGLPSQGEKVQRGASCVVSGWGTTREGGSVCQSLRYVAVPYVSEADCNNAYDGDIADSMLCAGVAGKDACQGDSGGPIVCNGSGNLTGIVSWGYGCAVDGYPGVYTCTSYYRNWIYENSGV